MSLTCKLNTVEVRWLILLTLFSFSRIGCFCDEYLVNPWYTLNKISTRKLKLRSEVIFIEMIDTSVTLKLFIYSNHVYTHTRNVYENTWRSKPFHAWFKLQTSTTPSCSGPIPAQKSRANSVPGDIFSHLMFEMNLYHFHRFSWEKIH